MSFEERVAWALKKPNLNKTQEKIWGNKINGTTDIIQWTTHLGENLVKDTLEKLGFNITKPVKKNHYQPDFEIETGIVEVKTRNWTTPGTAGEKVFGVPYKYSDVPRLYGKPLFIVCVGYQEFELTCKNTRIFGKDISPEKKNMLEYWSKMNIYFIPFSLFITMIDNGKKYSK